MELTIDTDIISGSSYLVYEGGLTKSSPINRSPGHVSKTSKNVTFYTFDGNPITTIKHNFDFEKMNAKLDPSALVPKPISFRKIFMPTFKCVDSMIVEAGYMVLFHDKNGNRILWELLNSVDENIKCWLEYDLSNAFEEESDFSLKDVEIDIIEYDIGFSLNDTQINFSQKTKINFGLSTINFGMSCMSLSRIDSNVAETAEREDLIEQKEIEDEKDQTQCEEFKEGAQDPSSCIIF